MINKKISNKTFSRIEDVLIIAMLLLCFSWAFFKISPATAILAILLFGGQQFIMRILKWRKRGSSLKNEFFGFINFLHIKKSKNDLKRTCCGNIIYPQKFLDRKQ